MSHIPHTLARLATINLHFALAEVGMDGSRDSIVRALDHIRQAEASLRLLAPELNAPPDDTDSGLEAALAVAPFSENIKQIKTILVDYPVIGHNDGP